MNPKSALYVLLVCLLVAGAVTVVDAGDKDESEHDVIRHALTRGEVLPLTKILGIAARHVPGDVIEVELEDEDDGRLIYELKVLTDTGRVREIEIDARTGAVLEIEDD